MNLLKLVKMEVGYMVLMLWKLKEKMGEKYGSYFED